jgi:hypothetical protein
VTVVIEDSQFRILHEETKLAACPRTVIKEVTRRSASGHIDYNIQGLRKASPHDDPESISPGRTSDAVSGDALQVGVA